MFGLSNTTGRSAAREPAQTSRAPAPCENEKSGAGELADDGLCVHGRLSEVGQEGHGRHVADSRTRGIVGDDSGCTVGRGRMWAGAGTCEVAAELLDELLLLLGGQGFWIHRTAWGASWNVLCSL